MPTCDLTQAPPGSAYRARVVELVARALLRSAVATMVGGRAWERWLFADTTFEIEGFRHSLELTIYPVQDGRRGIPVFQVDGTGRLRCFRDGAWSADLLAALDRWQFRLPPAGRADLFVQLQDAARDFALPELVR